MFHSKYGLERSRCRCCTARKLVRPLTGDRSLGIMSDNAGVAQKQSVREFGRGVRSPGTKFQPWPVVFLGRATRGTLISFQTFITKILKTISGEGIVLIEWKRNGKRLTGCTYKSITNSSLATAGTSRNVSFHQDWAIEFQTSFPSGSIVSETPTTKSAYAAYNNDNLNISSTSKTLLRLLTFWKNYHDPHLTDQSQEDRLTWALCMRHTALTQIIPAEVHLFTSMDTLSISINFEFIRKALRLFLFAHDDRSQRLVRRWKQVGSDYMENRREFLELDEILGNALRQYSGNPSAVNGEVEEIKVKEGEDPVIVALRLHALRESVENTLDVARRLFVETVKEFGMKMF
ncbi:hypothetical protein EV360DRAFT_75443 [Lentinula raphanica]|nr:hypothetical protein EV360DRAFT_75443 [Lentinula raphanica]